MTFLIEHVIDVYIMVKKKILLSLRVNFNAILKFLT